MEKNNNLLLIYYPSGGYGFYLARLINRYVRNIVQVDDKFEFDSLGTSHLLPLVYGRIHWNQNRNDLELSSAAPMYHNSILQGDYVLIPSCPGINDDAIADTMDYYPNSKFIRLWYDDNTWPLVFYNSIVKAMRGDIDKDVCFDDKRFGSSDDWARRENYSLLLKDHYLRQEWKPRIDDRVHNVNIYSLLVDPLQCLIKIANFLGSSINNDCRDLDKKHGLFFQCNPGTTLHFKILDVVNRLNENQNLSWVKDLYWQAVVNFYIERKYDVIIPCNTYSNWFASTAEIVTMLENQGTKV